MTSHTPSPMNRLRLCHAGYYDRCRSIIGTVRRNRPETHFFSWNFDTTGRIAHPASIVARTALEHHADLVTLTESRVEPNLVPEDLNREKTAFHTPGIW